MSVQEVTYHRVVCGREGCDRDSAAQGFTAAFPTVQQALDDWIRFDGTVDPVTGVTLCNWHAHEAPATAEPSPVAQADGHPDPATGPGAPELTERAAEALLEFMVADLQMRGAR